MAAVQGQKLAVVGPLLRQWLKLRGVDIPPQTFNRTPYLPHGPGVVVHPRARLADGVTLYQGATIGRAAIWAPPAGEVPPIMVEREVILCAGACVVVSDREPLTVAEGTVVGANSVLTRSTGPWEIWAGVPARKVGDRRKV